MTWRVGLVVFVLLVMVWTAGWWAVARPVWRWRAACADAQTAHIATSWSNRRHN
nr:hypothetical protein [Pseudomonas aeruginosa]